MLGCAEGRGGISKWKQFPLPPPSPPPPPPLLLPLSPLPSTFFDRSKFLPGIILLPEELPLTYFVSSGSELSQVLLVQKKKPFIFKKYFCWLLNSIHRTEFYVQFFFFQSLKGIYSVLFWLAYFADKKSSVILILVLCM